MHVVGYTLILLIEMNIGYHYGVQYWQTACLNASIFNGDEVSSSKDYTSVSVFVNQIGKNIIEPDINKSQLKFVPYNNKTLFALNGIIGLDKKTIETILEHRPFNSLQDYVTRMVDTKLISPKKSVTMAKAGMFDTLENKSKRQVMVDLVKLLVPKRDKVTMVQVDDVRHILPTEFDKYMKVYDFRKLIIGRDKVPMNQEIEKEFIENYANHVKYDFNNGKLEIDTKDFNKYYNKYIEPLKEELKKDVYSKELTKVKRREFWIEECLGTPEEWEIETILFNTGNFVLDYEQINERYELSNFNDLEDKPVESTNRRGFTQYSISAISGVVVGSNHIKRLVYLLTKNSGVVTLKLTRKQYPYYHEKLDNDPSWFDRGTKLIALGYKDNEAFMVRGNRFYSNPLIKIEGSRDYEYYNKKVVDM